MISVTNLSIHFANRYLFDNVTFTIGLTDKIGLIGRNGTGKTTLLKIIAKEESPEEGSITMPNDYTIGYLPQESITNSTRTVFKETETALSELKNVEKSIKKFNTEITERDDYESKEYIALIQKLTEANEHYKMLGGNSIEAEIEQILIGLGFKRSDFERPLSEFSGGWQMRVELAKILLRRPNCILLDEPTNHLDIDSIQWLENYLKNYRGSVVLVSHDRKFLDSVTNRTIEISVGKIYDFNLPYSKFIVTREEIRQSQIAAYKAQQKHIADTEKFVERFRYKATLASRVQSRIKQLEKLDRIEIEDIDSSSIRIKFPPPPRSGRLVAEAKNLTKRYGDNLVLDNIDFAIESGEKIAFVGRNGEGKSTLSRILVGMEEYEGALTNGHNVDIGYFAQHQAEMLDSDSTVFQVIDNAATGEMRTQVRNLLGAFLFSGESVDKKVKVLSGGEKSRLAMAKLLLQPFNFYIFDEPTNHLDMVAKDVLKNALQDYKGSLIIVSHDRDFLDGLTNKTILFKNQKLKEYPGSIYDFLEKQKLESLAELEAAEKKENSSENTEEIKTLTLSQQTREEKKRIDRETNRIRKQIEQCELEIQNLEATIMALEQEFSKPDFFSDVEASKTKQAEYEELRSKLSIKMEEWVELNEEMETIL